MTGGGGYVGSKLCQQLLERGYVVTSFDLHYPEDDDSGLINRIQVLYYSRTTDCMYKCAHSRPVSKCTHKGDIRNKDLVFSALADSKSDVVFHIASYGMSGREMVNYEHIMYAVHV